MRLRLANLWVPLVMLCASSAPLAAQVRMMYPPMYPYPYRFAAPESNVRLQITPKQAAVYVDGYFAGQVDQYDGVFQRLHVTPGQHELVIYLAGYRSLHEQLYLSPNATRRISAKMEPLRAGEPADPVPVPLNPPDVEGQMPPQPPQAQMPPPRFAPRRVPPPPPPPPSDGGGPGSGPSSTSSVGTVAVRVQPTGTEILIDGERWMSPARDDERLIVQLSEGRHTLTIHRTGYRDFSTDVDVRRGETTPVNVSLTPDR